MRADHLRRQAEKLRDKTKPPINFIWLKPGEKAYSVESGIVFIRWMEPESKRETKHL